jgi:hypothetical protein
MVDRVHYQIRLKLVRSFKQRDLLFNSWIWAVLPPLMDNGTSSIASSEYGRWGGRGLLGNCCSLKTHRPVPSELIDLLEFFNEYHSNSFMDWIIGDCMQCVEPFFWTTIYQ